MKRIAILIAGFLLLPLLVRLLMAQVPSAPPPTYTLTDLGPMTVGGIDSQNVRGGPTALNSNAQVVGFRANASFNNQFIGFFWDKGTFTDLGTGGGPSSFAYGINNAGQIVGTSNFPGDLTGNSARAFLWQNGGMTNLNPDPNFWSRAYAINTGGDVAGFINNGPSLPVIWKGGTAAGKTMLSSLPCSLANCQGEVLAINDLGQAAGWSLAGNVNVARPVMWDSNGQPTDLISNPGYYTEANGINNDGVVIGYYQPQQLSNSPIHAFSWKSGALTDLGAVGSDTNSGAWSINSRGDIVGISAASANAILVGPGGGGRAFLYTGGMMYDLSSLLAAGTNWSLETAFAINDSGQIVGTGRPVGGGLTEHGYLLTPVVTQTTTALTASVNPSEFGQQVSFTATVTPIVSSLNIPSGAVTFSDGATILGSGTHTNGVWIFSTAALSVGNNQFITASYSGDNNFAASTSPPLTQTVTQAGTITSLAASPSPASVGQAITLTATVTLVAPGAGTPTGTVTFFDGSTQLGTPSTLNSAGSSSLTTSSLIAGTHSATAIYGGGSNFAGSTSLALSLPVKQITSTNISATPNPSNTGQAVTLTSHVTVPFAGTTPSSASGNGGAPTGNVVFTDGNNPLGTSPLVGGTATLSTSSMTAGLHLLTATYSGDQNFASSSSDIVSHSVILLIAINERIAVTDAPSVLPSVMIPVNEPISVTDALTVLPSMLVFVAESISVADTPEVPQYVAPTASSVPIGILSNFRVKPFGSPQVDGNLGCYARVLSSPISTPTSEVNYFNLATQSSNTFSGPLDTEHDGDWSCDVRGSTLVVAHGGNVAVQGFNADPASAIYTFDTVNPSVAPLLVSSEQTNLTPRIGDQTIIWQATGIKDAQIFHIDAYDRSSATTQSISTKFLPDGTEINNQSPEISPDGQLAVWEGCTIPNPSNPTPSSCVIWKATLSSGTWTAQQVASIVGGDQRNPATDGSIIAYTAAILPDQSQHILVWQPVAGGTEQVLDLPGQYTSASVSNGLIAFAFQAPGTNCARSE